MQPSFLIVAACYFSYPLFFLYPPIVTTPPFFSNATKKKEMTALQLRATHLNAQLNSFYTELTTSGADAVDGAIYDTLAASLCRLTKIIIPGSTCVL